MSVTRLGLPAFCVDWGGRHSHHAPRPPIANSESGFRQAQGRFTDASRDV